MYFDSFINSSYTPLASTHFNRLQFFIALKHDSHNFVPPVDIRHLWAGVEQWAAWLLQQKPLNIGGQKTPIRGKCSAEDTGVQQTQGGSAGFELLLLFCQKQQKNPHQECLKSSKGADHISLTLTRVLLCEGDVGVHQTPGDAAGHRTNKTPIARQ